MPVCIYTHTQGAAKGGQRKQFDHYFSFLVTVRSLFLTLLPLFSSLFAYGISKILRIRVP